MIVFPSVFDVAETDYASTVLQSHLENVEIASNGHEKVVANQVSGILERFLDLAISYVGMCGYKLFIWLDTQFTLNVYCGGNGT